MPHLYASVNGHLDCFRIFTIVNSASVNIVVHVFFCIIFSGYMAQEQVLQEHMTTPFLGFKGTSVLFSIVAAPIYIPINNVGRFHFLHTLSAAAAAKLLQSCPTLCDLIGGSPPGSPGPGILQARTLEWVAISFSSA